MNYVANHLDSAELISNNIRKPIKCKDGFQVSIQASEFHYAQPRKNVPNNEYTAVELGFPNMADELIERYAEDPERPTETVYGWVPTDLVNRLIEKHGGPA